MLGLVVVFCLGIVNFAAHKAVLESGHPLLAQVPWFFRPLGGRLSLVVEFAMLLGAMVMAAAGSTGWTWIYAFYTMLNGFSAWLICSGKVRREPAECPPVFRCMAKSRKTWLVCNAASGSYDDEAVAQLERALDAAGYGPVRRIRFPEEDAPGASELEAGQVEVLAVFAGDGTVLGVVTGLYGWTGAILVLPGGTMNLLSKRLHGDVPAAEIAARLANDQARRVRPRVARTRHADGLTGVLAGPGAIWSEVREALRTAKLLEVVATAKDAIAWSATGPKVVCAGVDYGREEGYAAITVTPHETGLEVKGYYAETLGDYAGQGLALLNRNFREGPHDDLGSHSEVRLVCPEGEPMGLLIDGEPFDGASEELLRLGTCGVDLLETIDAR